MQPQRDASMAVDYYCFWSVEQFVAAKGICAGCGDTSSKTNDGNENTDN